MSGRARLEGDAGDAAPASTGPAAAELGEHWRGDAIPGASDCVLVVVDAETGHVLALSDAAERLSGFTRRQVVGRPAWDTLVPVEDVGMLQAAAVACASADTPMSMVGPIRTADGATLQVEWLAAPLAEPCSGAPQVLFYAETEGRTHGAARLFGHLMRAAAGTAVLTTDLRGVVTFVSSGAAALFGLAPGRLVGEPFPLDMLDEGEVAARAESAGLEPGLRVLLADPTTFERREGHLDLGDLDRRRQAATDRPPVRSADWTVRRGDGRVVTVAVSTRPLGDHRGRMVGHLSYGEDVTEDRAGQALLVSALRAERQAVVRLRELDRAKDELVATVSHELRTPLTSIVGHVEHLQEGGAGPLSPAQAAALDVVGRNADRLRALADDLLTVLRLDGEVDSSGFGLLDVGAILRDVHDAVPALVRGRMLDVRVSVPTEPVVVRGDRPLLERALLNLLSNAVKFTEDGGRVDLSCRVVDDTVLLEVADTGIGLAPAEVDRVFGRFVRGSRAQQLAVPGTGLGLCIVASVVREHGGQVEVESEPGVGSSFRVSLPRACPAAVEESA